jgi:arylsulfatase
MTSEPNVVFIMPDQLRHDFLSCYDASFVDTPNIDALCAQGVRYRNAYSEHPVN